MAQDFGDETGEMIFRFFMQKTDELFRLGWERINKGIESGIAELDARIKVLSAAKDGKYAELAFTPEEYGTEVEAAMIKQTCLDEAKRHGLDVRDASGDGKIAIRFKTDLATATGVRDALVVAREITNRSGERAVEARSKIAEREVGLDPVMLTADRIREASQKAMGELVKDAAEQGVHPSNLDGRGAVRIELGDIKGMQEGQGKPAALSACDVLRASGINAEVTGMDGDLAITLPSSSQRDLALTDLAMADMQRSRAEDLRDMAARTPAELLEDPDKVNRTVKDGPIPEGYDKSVRTDPDKTVQLDTPTREIPVVEASEQTQAQDAPAPDPSEAPAQVPPKTEQPVAGGAEHVPAAEEAARENAAPEFDFDDDYLAAVDGMAASYAYENDSRAVYDLPASAGGERPVTAPSAAETAVIPPAAVAPQQEQAPGAAEPQQKPDVEAPVIEHAKEKEPDPADALTKPEGEPKRGTPASVDEYNWTLQLGKTQLRGKESPDYKAFERELGSFEEGKTTKEDLAKTRAKNNLNERQDAPANGNIDAVAFYAQNQHALEQERRAAARGRDHTHEAPSRGGDAI